MPNENKQQLNSAEIANLWYLYMEDTLIACFKKYSVAKAEDKQIQAILQEALNISDRRSKDIASIFSSENLPIPVGFSDEDVNIDAPRLYSDTFALYHVISRTRFALMGMSTSLISAVRPDIRKLFRDAIASSTKLNEDATQVALANGLLVSSPIVNIPQSPHFVEKSSYIGHIMGKQRPLHVISLMHLFLSIQENILARALATGFSQVVRDPEVREFLLRGVEISTKHIKILSSLMSDDYIPIPQSPDSMVSSSTIPPFSDKFMMNHILLINSFNLSTMGSAIGQSNRLDIAADYMRLGAEVVQYGEDGINISIKNGWMEAPPQVVSHRELALSGEAK
jgi:hypothetical protein